MSKEHPVVVVTGSSGAGTTSVRIAFQHIFRRLGVKPFYVEGDSFHKYDRNEMRRRVEEALEKGEKFGHFSLEANLLEKQQELFESYGRTGHGQQRFYIHTVEEAQQWGREPGTFTPWQDAGEGTDLLFYEGLHGAVVADGINMVEHADLLIGVVPIVNLEWIQKIHRDTAERGYDADEVTETILRRMYDYVKVIAPQFSLTDINFQRVPTVDTSNPFVARDIPTPEESIVVIRFRDPVKLNTNFPYLLQMLQNSFMSRRNSIVVPGGKMGLAFEIIFEPILARIMRDRKDALAMSAGM
jgi:phosphoribulokinase